MGQGVIKGRDFTIQAVEKGTVVFTKKKTIRFDGKKFLKTVV